jgi:hypothetical protein
MQRFAIGLWSLFVTAHFVGGCLLMLSPPGDTDDVGGDDDNDNDDGSGPGECNFEQLGSASFDDANRLLYEDGYVYALNDRDLAVFDVSTPSDITLVAGVDNHFYNARDFALRDGYIFVIDPSTNSYSDSELYVFSAPDPEDDPQQVRVVEMNRTPKRIELAKGRAYVSTHEYEATGNEPLLIYVRSSLEDSSGPPVYSAYYTDGWFSALEAVGDYLYTGFVSNDYEESTYIKVLDITSPGDPVKVRQLTAQGDINQLYERYGYLFASVHVSIDDGISSAQDLMVLSLADPDDPYKCGSYSDGSEYSFGMGVAVAGDFAYTLVGSYGSGSLDVVDFFDQYDPVLFDSYFDESLTTITLNRNTNDGALYLGTYNDILVYSRCNP